MEKNLSKAVYACLYNSVRTGGLKNEDNRKLSVFENKYLGSFSDISHQNGQYKELPWNTKYNQLLSKRKDWFSYLQRSFKKF